MRYATAYDIGDRKREENGINEDSIEVALFEDGHRDGFEPPGFDPAADEEFTPTVRGPGDDADGDGEETPASDDRTTEVFERVDERGRPRNRTAGVFVLADGAGGEDAGDLASYVATTVIARELSAEVHDVQLVRPDGFDVELDASLIGGDPDPEDIEAAIADAVAEAGRTLVDYANEAGLRGTYTTVVAGVYLRNQFHYGWIGDSRIYVVNRAHDDIALLTRDHAKVTRLEEEGKIDEYEAHVHPDGNEITRAIGGGSGDDPDAVAGRMRDDVETRTVSLYREDVVLLTSDGLIDAQTDYFELYREYVASGRDDDVGEEVLDAVVTDDLLREVIVDAESLDEAADRFVELSNEKGGKDNISVVLFADELLPASPPPAESGIEERALDPDTPVADRPTIIRRPY